MRLFLLLHGLFKQLKVSSINSESVVKFVGESHCSTMLARAQPYEILFLNSSFLPFKVSDIEINKSGESILLGYVEDQTVPVNDFSRGHPVVLQ